MNILKDKRALLLSVMMFVFVAGNSLFAQNYGKGVQFWADWTDDSTSITMNWMLEDEIEFSDIMIFVAKGFEKKFDESKFELLFEIPVTDLQYDTIEFSGRYPAGFYNYLLEGMLEQNDEGYTLCCKLLGVNGDEYETNLEFLSPKHDLEEFNYFSVYANSEAAKVNLSWSSYNSEHEYTKVKVWIAKGFVYEMNNADFVEVLDLDLSDIENDSLNSGHGTMDSKYYSYAYDVIFDNYPEGMTFFSAFYNDDNESKLMGPSMIAVREYKKPEFYFWASQYELENNIAKIRLMWNFEDINHPYTDVKLYLSSMIYDDEGKSPYEVVLDISIDELIAEELEDSVFNGQKGQTYYYDFEYERQEGQKMVSMYSVAYNSDKESAPSDVFYMEFYQERPYYHLYFDSKPETKAFLNTEYSYQPTIDFESNDNKNTDFEYTFKVDGPEGMTINEETGLINWTPNEAGFFNVWISAQVVDNPEYTAEQYFYIHVFKCSNETKMIIEVVNEDGDLVNDGMISIFATNEHSTDSTYYSNISQESFSLNDEGGYEILVDEGSYYLYYQSYNYETLPQWYNGALTRTDATAIDVECGETKVINFVIKEELELEYFVASGFVKDTEGNPIANATVYFENRSYWGEKYWDYEDGMHGNKASTDANGYYEVELASAFEYIAYAYSNDSYAYDNRIIYYNQAYEYENAEIIRLEADRKNINFTFKKGYTHNPDSIYSCQGQVVNETGTGLENCIVLSFLVDSEYNTDADEMYVGQAVMADAQGNFKFNSLVPGDYVFFAISTSMDYVPGFYIENEIAGCTWEEATKVNISAAEIAYNLTITLADFESVYGICHLDGTVGGDTDGIQDEGTPIAGASVYLKNSNDKVVKYDKTDNSGRYSMNNIAPGLYTLTVDKVGYDKYVTTIEIDNTEQNNRNDVNLGKEFNTSVNDDIHTVSTLSVFPNPTSDQITLTFNALNGTSNIKVVNSTGAKVFSSELTTVHGQNTWKYNTENLSNGLYFIIIDDSIIPFVVKK